MNSKQAESFGAYLYAIRIQKDLSQREMAKRLSVSAAYVGAIENERRFPPSVATARQWAEQLQLNSSAQAQLLAACAREQRSTLPMARNAQRVWAICRRLGPRIPPDALREFEQRLREVF